MNAIILKYALGLVLAAIPIGLLTSLVFQYIKKHKKVIDEMPAWQKQGALYFIALVVTAVGQALGVEVSCNPTENCLDKLDEPTLRVMIQSALALVTAKLTHLVIRKKR
jgi:hypothetical protein